MNICRRLFWHIYPGYPLQFYWNWRQWVSCFPYRTQSLFYPIKKIIFHLETKPPCLISFLKRYKLFAKLETVSKKRRYSRKRKRIWRRQTGILIQKLKGMFRSKSRVQVFLSIFKRIAIEHIPSRLSNDTSTMTFINES